MSPLIFMSGIKYAKCYKFRKELKEVELCQRKKQAPLIMKLKGRNRQRNQRKKSKLLIIIVALVVLLGGAAGAYFFSIE